jgi:glutamine amidotransferase PdxT
LIDAVRGDARALATLPDGRTVAAQEGHWLATAFHPELTSDNRFHRYFLAMAAAAEYRERRLSVPELRFPEDRGRVA